MRTLIKAVVTASALALAALPVMAEHRYNPQDPAKADWLTFIDIHHVTNGEEALEYAKFVKPLAGKHGVELMHVYDVLGVEAGGVAAEWIFLFRSPNPETFGALLNEPEYAANVRERDRVDDMEWVKRIGWDLTEWPHLKAWHDRLMARPGYQRGFAAPDDNRMAGFVHAVVGLPS